VGDMFDVMQGRYDPRRSYDDLRPEYKTSTYLDDIVKDAADFFKPYAKNFLMIGRGKSPNILIGNLRRFILLLLPIIVKILIDI